MGRSDEDEYFGDPIKYDPNFRGPLKNRSCTDILCLALFGFFIAAWIGIGIYAVVNGDPSMLLVPKDTYGRRCGKDFDVLDKPYLLFFDLTKCINPAVPFTGCQTPQVCVNECPQDNWYSGTGPPLNETQTAQYCDSSNCPNWLLKSSPVQNRCLPNLDALNQTFLDLINANSNDIKTAVGNVKLLAQAEEVGQNIVEDILHVWWKILVGVLLALIACIIYILMLRWIAAPMVWLSIFGALAALGAAIYFATIKYLDFKKQVDQAIYEEDKPSLKTKRDMWLVGLVILSVVTGIILLVLIFLRKRINLAIALIKEGSKAVSSVTASLFFPVLPWILQVGVIVYAIAVALFLTSTGEALYKTRYVRETPCANFIQDDVKCNPREFYDSVKNGSINLDDCKNATCKFIKMENDALYPYLQFYNVFGFFWLAFFVSAFGQMVLAGVFAQWYWTWEKQTLPFFAVTSALFRTLRYHIGTLAFGSLIIAICRMIRVCLEYVDQQLKKYDNALTKALLCCCKCFFFCLEQFLKFINKNAYIMCAIHGRNFCCSAKDAFMLLMRNIIRVFVLDKVTDFLFFLSKVLITLGVAAVSYLFFASDLLPNFIDNSSLHYRVVPIVIIAICTYLISSLFFSVYSMAVDTLFLCFLEDCERNDGTAEKPYFMSKNLMRIFGRKNKFKTT